jgi:hypothetical protein
LNHQPKARLGVQINLGFSVYQHASGLPLLKALQVYFKTGRLYLKPGSLDVWVFEINDRKSSTEKVIPFSEQYVLPFSCKFVSDSQGAYNEQTHGAPWGLPKADPKGAGLLKADPPSCGVPKAHRGGPLYFKRLLHYFDQKKHLDKQGLIECVHLVYKMNPFSKGKKRKRTVQEVIDLISHHPAQQ